MAGNGALSSIEPHAQGNVAGQKCQIRCFYKILRLHFQEQQTWLLPQHIVKNALHTLFILHSHHLLYRHQLTQLLPLLSNQSILSTTALQSGLSQKLLKFSNHCAQNGVSAAFEKQNDYHIVQIKCGKYMLSYK